MFNSSRLSVAARYVGAFLLQFAHGGLVVAGLIVTVLIGFRVADHGWTGVNVPSLFGRAEASVPSVDQLTPGDLAETAQVAEAEEEASPEPESKPLPPKLSSDMVRVTRYLARRYHVSRAAVEPLVLAAKTAGESVDLDPLLIIAVVGVESGFNPFAESAFGAQGLMQVVPRYHKDKIDPQVGHHPLLDPAENIRVGAKVLKESISRNGSLVAGLQQYAGAATDPATAYASRVIAEKQRLHVAMKAGTKLASAN
ncbi:transglycosylase SLT domain-containing protein [Niveibacterium terrae]|uniref:transglycosylase SLT domain-containing protein n=1 Tax=Niveibacterium terrae TaxID=3373598 RepID=UPI003A8D9C64